MLQHLFSANTYLDTTRSIDELETAKTAARMRAYEGLIGYVQTGLTYSIRLEERTTRDPRYPLRHTYECVIRAECNVDATLPGFLPPRLDTPIQNQEAPIAGWYPIPATLPPIEVYEPEQDSIASIDVLIYGTRKAADMGLDDGVMFTGWYDHRFKRWRIYAEHWEGIFTPCYWTYLPRITLPGVLGENPL